MTGTIEAGEDHPQDQSAKLARMAGEIAGFFKAYPDEQAAASIADHINQFWGRRMRAEFLGAFTATSPELPPLVQRAYGLIRPVKHE